MSISCFHENKARQAYMGCVSLKILKNGFAYRLNERNESPLYLLSLSQLIMKVILCVIVKINGTTSLGAMTLYDESLQTL